MKKIISNLNKTGTSLCKLPNENRWGIFVDPIEILTSHSLDDVEHIMKKIENEFSDKYICGFLSYEASPAFDTAHKVAKCANFPLIWFAVYNEISSYLTNDDFKYNESIENFQTDLERTEYLNNIKKIADFIYAGDIYQANYTFRMLSKKVDNPGGLFLHLFNSHPVPYPAYINTGEMQIISNSPELFLESNIAENCEDIHIKSKPMKGTIARDFLYADDLKVKKFLQNDKKNRAENLMIVDMVRNDLGKICKLGSIKVEPLFDIETYKTVHQMVTTVHGVVQKSISLFDIFKSSFPPASITGAPKIRAMEIIHSIENSPRKAYTGTIGLIAPSGEFCFNVAIRTIINTKEQLELGIGGGIVSDSKAEDEWDEALLKSSFASKKNIHFNLIETLLWTKAKGYSFLEEHLERLHNSQLYFGRKVNIQKIKSKLLKNQWDNEQIKVRIELSENGNFKIESQVLSSVGWGKDKLKLKISDKKTDSKSIYQYHKTTNRCLYNSEYKSAICAGYDEVLFFNSNNEIAECAISNIFLLIDGNWITPHIKSGLLPGIWRKEKIEELNAKEKSIDKKLLLKADKIIIGNSVRGMGIIKKWSE